MSVNDAKRQTKARRKLEVLKALGAESGLELMGVEWHGVGLILHFERGHWKLLGSLSPLSGGDLERADAVVKAANLRVRTRS